MATPTTVHVLIDGDALHRAQTRHGQQIGKYIATDFARVLEFAGSEAFGPLDVVAAFYGREAPAARKLHGHLAMLGVALHLSPQGAPWQHPKDGIVTALDQVAEDPNANVIIVGGDGYGGLFAGRLRRIAGSSDEGGFLRKLTTGAPPARQVGVLYIPGELGIQGVDIQSWDLAEIGALIERELNAGHDPRPTPAADRAAATAAAVATSDILVIVDAESVRGGICAVGGSAPRPAEEDAEFADLAGYTRSKAEPGTRAKVSVLVVRSPLDGTHRSGQVRPLFSGALEITTHDPEAEVNAALAAAGRARYDEVWLASHRDHAASLTRLAAQRRGEVYLGVVGVNGLLDRYAGIPEIEVHDLGLDARTFGRHLPRARQAPALSLEGAGGDRILERLFREAR